MNDRIGQHVGNHRLMSKRGREVLRKCILESTFICGPRPLYQRERREPPQGGNGFFLEDA